MVGLITNKEDCKHFDWQDIEWCCGRKRRSGVCTLSEGDLVRDKPCSTIMPYCKYAKREIIDVHSTELPSLNRRDGHSN